MAFDWIMNVMLLGMGVPPMEILSGEFGTGTRVFCGLIVMCILFYSGFIALKTYKVDDKIGMVPINIIHGMILNTWTLAVTFVTFYIFGALLKVVF